MAGTKLTLLNNMAAAAFEDALDRHVAWGLEVLDLKAGIFGRGIVDLTDEEAERAADLIRARNLSVYCFSTELFSRDIELGEREFRENHLGKIDRTIEIAEYLRPKVIRLLSARTSRRAEIEDSIPYIRAEHPWLIPLYAEAVDRLHRAGYKATIENEVPQNIFSTPGEILDFFEALGRPGRVSFTWDVQNLWQMGTYPTVEVYDKLKGIIGYYHLKGGQHDSEGTDLCWKSSLEDASWPVVEITAHVVADGVSPVICLNSSHGKQKDGYDYSDITERDLDFIRSAIPEIA